jgi:hypothetical protein
MKAHTTKAENLADLAPTPAAPAAAIVQSEDVSSLRRRWEQVALIKKGGFTQLTAILAVDGCDLDAADTVAFWLRVELDKLRDSKKATLPRVEIADLAITMLERLSRFGFRGSGENLISLLRELLEVDRHRKKIAPNEKLRLAAMIDGMSFQNYGKFLGVRELARRVGVRPRAIVDWRRSATYHKEISMGLWISQREIAALFASLSKK